MRKTTICEIQTHRERLRREIKELGDELRDKKMPDLNDELFGLYEKTGNRLEYENVYFKRRQFLTVFGLLSLWYGQPKDLGKLKEVIQEICGEKTWALPAHVNRKEPGWTRTVDLFASETGQALSQITFQLKGKLPEALTQQVRELVRYRLLDSYMETPVGGWRWEHMYNNWVAVCAGSLGSMALYLLDEEPALQKAIIDRVCGTLPDYLSGMCEDGTCPEGLSYFTYGMMFYVNFARQLLAHTQGTLDLMASEKIRRIALFQQVCYLAGGSTVSFSDGSRSDRYHLGLTCYLASRYQGVEIPDISAAMVLEDDHCNRFLGSYQDDEWSAQYLREVQKKEELEENIQKEENMQSVEATQNNLSSFTLLPDACWAIWKDGPVGIACKGGHNAEPHNHNDVGSFLFTVNGEWFLTDLGCGEYTREYFNDSTRYQILCNRSLGHSVPLLNNREQSTGSQYGSTFFASSQEGQIKMRYDAAYEEGIVERLVRELEYVPGSTLLRVMDEAIGLGADGSFLENLVTQIEPKIEEDTILLKGEKGIVTIGVEKVQGSIQARKEIFHNHRGVQEDVWLLQWQVPLQEGTGRCEINIRWYPMP